MNIVDSYYKKQLIIGTSVCLILMVAVTLLREYKIDIDHDLFRIAIALTGTILFFALNVFINAFNYTYRKHRSRFKAFYVPIIIWAIFVFWGIFVLIENGGYIISDWIFVILFLEPIVYNLILDKAIANNV